MARTLRLMGAALVLASLVGIRDVAADFPGCKRDGKACKRDAQCCSGSCDGGACAAACLPDDSACTATSQCCSGTCVIELGTGFCEGPNLVQCECDTRGHLAACRTIDCASRAAIDAVCESLCGGPGFTEPTCTPGACL